MPSPNNTTNITPPRVPLIDERTGLISREWYRFFLNLFTLTGSGTNVTSLTDLQLGPPAPQQEDLVDIIIDVEATKIQPTEESANEQIAELAKQVEGLEATPIPALDQIAELAKQVEGLAATPIPALGTFAALQQANLPWTTFDTTPQSVPPDIGTVAWAGGTTLGIQMTANVVQRIGEAQYFYIKADSTITKGQLIMFTGAVGASGVIKGAPATGLTDGQYLIGLAAENIAANGFGLVTSFGNVRGWNTTGSPVGETWVDGDILYYNPTIAGGLTKTQPLAPNVKATIAVVVNAAPAGSGDVFVRVSSGSVLGGTDSNVPIGTLANGNLIQYDSALQYWKNVAPSSIVVGTATNLAGGATGSVPYQSAASTTAMLPIGTALQVLKVNAGATAPEWVSGAALTKVDDTNVTLTLGGTPTTSLLAATSLTLGWTGQLSAARGGTGTGVYVVGDILYADTTSTLAKLADVATGNALISGGVGVAPSYGKIGLTTHVSGVLPTANGGTNLSSFTANGIVYASSSSALATGSALSFDGTNFSTTGSATATAFIPSGSSVPTNGLYLPAVNTIALSTNTTEVLRATSNGEILVNGTTAISSSAGTISIQRNDSDPSLRFFRNDTTISSGNSFGTLSWYGNDTTSNLPVIHAYIEAQASATHAAGDNPTDIVFGTTPDNTAVVAEAMRITQAKNLKIGGTASRGTTEGTNQLVLFNGTAPVGTLTNGVSFYSAAGEARVMDAAGNSTLLSPHDQATNEWIFHSKHTPTGKVLRIDVEKMLRFINDHFGLDMVHEFTEDA
jgi:hypothetical protein